MALDGPVPVTAPPRRNFEPRTRRAGTLFTKLSLVKFHSSRVLLPVGQKRTNITITSKRTMGVTIAATIERGRPYVTDQDERY